jgi:hypothetical protein
MLAWYDWILWLLVLYMTIGSDIGLNLLTGVVWGKRIDRNSRNPFNRLYYYIWASTDPIAGPVDRSLVDNSGVTAPINRRPLDPMIVSICQINLVIVVTAEMLILVGMFTHGPYLRPAAFLFIYRGLIEILYASQLIWGPGGVRGRALVSYLLIGLIPQTLAPFLVAMRFASGIEPNILWWQPLVFLGVPYAIFGWTSWVCSRRNTDQPNPEPTHQNSQGSR